MDQDTLAGYASGAKAASENVAQFQQDIPGLLSGLKTNLTSIFAKDNPMMAAREGALNTYLNTPSQTRANLLPSNQPIIGGSALNFSPTQQNAMVESAQNAALVPLLGLNSSIVSQYGNIGDILQAAAQTYQSQLDAAKTRATSAQDLYKIAVAQDQFDRELALKQQEASSNSNILQDWINYQNQGDDWVDLPQTGVNNIKPTQKSIEIPGQGVIQSYNPTPITSGPNKWNPFDQLGALGNLFFGNRQPASTAASLNLLGQNNNNGLYISGQ